MHNSNTYYSKLIFIADDDPEDIELFCETIRDIDTTIHTQTFNNGKEILYKLNTCTDQELPGFLILDYSMPELTGFQVLKEIAKQPRYDGIAKIIFSTSNASRYVDECMNSGATAYFVKPNSMNDLKSIARKMLEIPL